MPASLPLHSPNIPLPLRASREPARCVLSTLHLYTELRNGCSSFDDHQASLEEEEEEEEEEESPARAGWWYWRR